LVLAEEDRRMLEFVGLESTKRRLRPRYGGRIELRRATCDAPRDQLVQMILKGCSELGVVCERGIGADEHALVGEVPFPEAIQGLELLRLQFESIGVPGIKRCGFAASVHQKIGPAALL